MKRDKYVKKINTKWIYLNISTLVYSFGFMFFWFIHSAGTFKLTTIATDGRAYYYSVVAERLLSGKFDVPLWAASAADLVNQPGECLVYSNKCYTYYGLTPSLLRLPAVILTDYDSNLGSTPFILLEYIIFLAACFLLTNIILTKYFKLDTLQMNKAKIFISSTIVVSPQVVLSSRGYFYEEAILTAITFLILSVYFLLQYDLTNKSIYKYFLYLSIFLTLHSRFTEGIVAILIYSAYVINKKIKIRLKVYEISKVTSIFSTLILFNFIKFKTLFPSFTTNHVQTYSNINRKTFYEKYGQFNPLRSVEMLATWLWPNTRNWPSGLTYFPENYNLNLLIFELKNIRTESTEGFISLPVFFPLSVFVSFIGLVYLYRLRIANLNIVSFGLFINVLFFTGYISQTLRYAAEFSPLILILVIIGFGSMVKIQKSKKLVYLIYSILFVFQFFSALLVTINFFESINSSDLPIEHILFYTKLREILIY